LIEIKAADATLSKIPRAHRKASKPIEHVAGGGAATGVRYFSGLGRSPLPRTITSPNRRNRPHQALEIQCRDRCAPTLH